MTNNITMTRCHRGEPTKAQVNVIGVLYAKFTEYDNDDDDERDTGKEYRSEEDDKTCSEVEPMLKGEVNEKEKQKDASISEGLGHVYSRPWIRPWFMLVSPIV